MSTFEIRTHIGSDGKLEIVLPPALTDIDVDVLIKPSNGAWRTPVTREERDRVLEELAQNGIDDPTFIRHPQGEYEVREPLD